MRLNPFLLIPLLYGVDDPLRRRKPPEDELNIYLRINNRTLEEEYRLVQEKKSGLSSRLRDVVEYRYEQKYKHA